MSRAESSPLFVVVVVLGCLVFACSPALDDHAAPVIEARLTPSGLYFESVGSGDSVVLLHGFSLDRRMWDREVESLSAGHRVIRYDQRGHGQSNPWQQPFSHHEDLLELLATTGVERATLVGLSGGAEIAVDFTLVHPERIERLVLVSPGLSGYSPQGSFEWMAPVLTALQVGDAEEATRRWVETPLMRLADPAADAAMREIRWARTTCPTSIASASCCARASPALAS